MVDSLSISELSRCSCEASGNKIIWLRLDKSPDVDFTDDLSIIVRFCNQEDDWSVDMDSKCYSGVLLTVNVPPYKCQDILEEKSVKMQLVVNEIVSASVDFVYTPNQDVGPVNPGTLKWLPYDKPAPVTLDEVTIGTDPNESTVDVHVDKLRTLQRVLAELWRTQVHALWNYASDSEPKTLVNVFSNLLGYQDPDEHNTVLHIAGRNRQPLAMATLLRALDDCCEQSVKSAVVDAVNVRGQTALHVSVRYGDPECVHYLRRSGASAHICDKRNNTVAHYLADTFSEDMYRDVLQPCNMETHGIPLDVLNFEGETALHIATRRLKSTLVEVLLEANSPHSVPDSKAGRTPLHFAVAAGDVSICGLLVKYGADVNSAAFDGSTPLHWAVHLRHEPIIATLLCATGADPNLKTAKWHWLKAVPSADLLSPLDVAVILADERVQTLLKGGKLDELRVPDTTPEPPPISMLPISPPTLTPPPVPPRPILPEDNLITPQNLCTTVGGPNDPNGHKLVGGSSVLATSVARPYVDANVEQGAQHGHVEMGEMVPGTSREEYLNGDEEAGLPERLQDDLCCADYVTRVRLAQSLDENGLWRELASKLGCEHMVEFIAAIDASDSSPTVLLLDQYEQMPGSRLSKVAVCLQEMGLTDAKKVLEPLLNRLKQPKQPETVVLMSSSSVPNPGGSPAPCKL